MADEARGSAPSRRIRVLRVIARMNVGGPAYHVSLLSGRLEPDRYETLLVSGNVGPGEASFEELARRYGARLDKIDSLGPEIDPWADLRAFIRLVRTVRRFRPDIVHTHTAKAGALGRAAALFTRPRPVIVHTFHGHVLEGYFGPVLTRVYRFVERALAKVTDCLVAVSEATANDLIRLGVAPREKFRVIPLGLDLDRFLAPVGQDRERFRREVGASADEVLFTYVGRLVPIKRLDLALRAVARARAAGAPVRLAVVGGGTLRGELEALAQELSLSGHVRFLGYRSDLDVIAAGTDVALLTSANEGTPVSLIEAAAAGRPAVATAVGGVPEVVTHETGLLTPPDNEEALADAMVQLASDTALRSKMGRAARDHVFSRFGSARLTHDIAALYCELLGTSHSTVSVAGGSRACARPD